MQTCLNFRRHIQIYANVCSSYSKVMLGVTNVTVNHKRNRNSIDVTKSRYQCTNVNIPRTIGIAWQCCVLTHWSNIKPTVVHSSLLITCFSCSKHWAATMVLKHSWPSQLTTAITFHILGNFQQMLCKDLNFSFSQRKGKIDASCRNTRCLA